MRKGLTLCLGLLGLATSFVSFATLLGIGVLREGPAWALSLSAGAVILLPILAIGFANRQRAEAWVSALVLWPILVYTALPLYFPGERSQGLATGLGAIAAMSGNENTMRSAASFGETLADLLGPEILTGRAPAQDAVVTAEPIPPANDGAHMENEDSTALPYEGAGRSLRVQVVFDADDSSQELWMLFDTGATYTTLTTEALSRLGVPVPEDAQTITLNTANGEVEAPIVLLERVWLGGFPVEGVTVAVCADCAGEDHEGLLGLNVSGQFSVTLEPGRNEMLLKPAEGTNRTMDLAHWMQISAMTWRYPDGRVEVEVSAENLTDRVIDEAVVTIDCGGDKYDAALEEIPTHGSAQTRVALPRDSDCEQTLIQLQSANW